MIIKTLQYDNDVKSNIYVLYLISKQQLQLVADDIVTIW